MGQIKIGDSARIHRLSSAAGQLLNGRIGRVVSHDRQANRYGIEIDGNVGLKSIKEENLELVNEEKQPEAEVEALLGSASHCSDTHKEERLKFGDSVSIRGLAPSLNDRVAMVLSYDLQTDSYSVKFADESTTTIAAINVRQVHDSTVFNMEDLAMQAAIQGSMMDAAPMERVAPE